MRVRFIEGCMSMVDNLPIIRMVGEEAIIDEREAELLIRAGVCEAAHEPVQRTATKSSQRRAVKWQLER